MKYSMVAMALALLAVTGCVSSAGKSTASSGYRGNGVSCSSGVNCQNMGLSHAGQGTEEQYVIAAKYFKRSCDYGMDEGCNNLAFLYANARGVKQSYTQAYRYWGMACRMGNQSACANLELAKEKVAELHREK